MLNKCLLCLFPTQGIYIEQARDIKLPYDKKSKKPVNEKDLLEYKERSNSNGRKRQSGKQ